MSQPNLQAHCQSRTSQRFNQSFVKELAKPAQEKNIKIFLPRFRKKKIKTRQHTGITDRKEDEANDKFNMKVQFDSNLRTDKNRQCITGGIFYCRASAAFSVSASNKLLYNLTGQCFEIGNKNIPPIRYGQV
jgi:hypothetical protein